MQQLELLTVAELQRMRNNSMVAATASAAVGPAILPATVRERLVGR